MHPAATQALIMRARDCRWRRSPRRFGFPPIRTEASPFTLIRSPGNRFEDLRPDEKPPSVPERDPTESVGDPSAEDQAFSPNSYRIEEPLHIVQQSLEDVEPTVREVNHPFHRRIAFILQEADLRHEVYGPLTRTNVRRGSVPVDENILQTSPLVLRERTVQIKRAFHVDRIEQIGVLDPQWKPASSHHPQRVVGFVLPPGIW